MDPRVDPSLPMLLTHAEAVHKPTPTRRFEIRPPSQDGLVDVVMDYVRTAAGSVENSPVVGVRVVGKQIDQEAHFHEEMLELNDERSIYVYETYGEKGFLIQRNTESYGHLIEWQGCLNRKREDAFFDLLEQLMAEFSSWFEREGLPVPTNYEDHLFAAATPPRGELTKLVKQFAIRDGCVKGETVPSAKIERWKREVNKTGFETTTSSIRSTCSRLGFSKERPAK